MLILNDFKQSGHHNINEFHRMRREDMERKREEGSHQVQNMLNANNNMTTTFGQNNQFVTPVKE